MEDSALFLFVHGDEPRDRTWARLETRRRVGDEMLTPSDKMTLNAMTIMAGELEALLDAVPSLDAAYKDFERAIVEGNCLGRATLSARKKGAMYLKRLYGLDPADEMFRVFRKLWAAKREARPLLALQRAWVGDSLVRDSAEYFLKLNPGDAITTEATAKWLREKRGDRHSEANARTIARNLNSSWHQAGFVNGIAARSRKRPLATPENMVFALYLSHLDGCSGISLFETQMSALLDIPVEAMLPLAAAAGRMGLIGFRRIADVIEVGFDTLKGFRP